YRTARLADLARSRLRLLPVERDRVPRRCNQRHSSHSRKRYRASDVKQKEGPATDLRIRFRKCHRVSQRKQDSNLCRTKKAVRQMKASNRVRCQVALDRENIKTHQHSGRDWPMHITRTPEPGHERQRAEGVRNVIDVKSVAWTLLVTDSGQCSIETVPQPVQKKET